MRRALLAMTWVVSACGSGSPVDDPLRDAAVTYDAAADAAAALSDAGADAAADPDAGEPPCAIALIEEHAASYPSRLWAPVIVDGDGAALLVDTGSALTFLDLGADGPAFVEDAGAIDTGCESVRVAGRGFDPAPAVEGLPVLGTLGADYFLQGTTALDLAGETLTRWPLGTTISGTEDDGTVLFDDVQGHIIATIVADGQTLRLMVDTGSPDLLWLGQQGLPGDEEVHTTDAEGNDLTLYLGTTMLEMAGEAPTEVPVLRAPSFPYFEETVRLLGGNIQGLLGLSSFGSRRIVVDPEASALRLEPRRR